MSEICLIIQKELLQNDHILLRGSITKGDVFYDDEIIFGAGIVKAYINEERAVYPRIIIAKELVDEYVNRVGTSRITYITDFLLKDDDGLKIEARDEYAIEYLEEILDKYAGLTSLNPDTFVNGKGRRKTLCQRQYEKLTNYIER